MPGTKYIVSPPGLTLVVPVRYWVVVLSYTRNVLVLTVVGSMAALVCRLMAAFSGTFEAFTAGFALTTNGVYVSGIAAVVKCVVDVGTTFPATSFTPDTVSVNCVDAGSGFCGVICTAWFPLPKLIVCELPAAVTCIVESFTDSGSTGPLNCTRMFAFTGTFESWFAGLTTLTVGATVSGPAPVAKHAPLCCAASPLVPCTPAPT